mgnify:CR=1 FL=1
MKSEQSQVQLKQICTGYNCYKDETLTILLINAGVISTIREIFLFSQLVEATKYFDLWNIVFMK